VSDPVIVILIVVGMVALFMWDKLPPFLVALGMALAFFLTGILSPLEAISGFGDPIVILIAGLFVISASLEAAGITAWASQKIIVVSGGNEFKAMLAMFVIGACLAAVIGFMAAVAALIPVCVLLAARLKIPSSQIMIPMAFVIYAASMLTLLGTHLNMIAYGQIQNLGKTIGMFEFAVIGIPLLIGTGAIMLFTRKFLLPHRNGESMPQDFSSYAQTLVEYYRLDSDFHRLRVRDGSPLAGQAVESLSLEKYPGLKFKAVQDPATNAPTTRGELAVGDYLLIRGDAREAALFAQQMALAFRDEGETESATDNALFGPHSGLAEVVIPPRSEFIGRTAFPGMATPKGDLIILAIQRGDQQLDISPTELRAGDKLLLQGTWAALDKRLDSPQVLVVNAPGLVRRQAVALGPGSKPALAILLLMIGLLAFNVFPPVISVLICAALMFLFGVITPKKAFAAVDWEATLLLGAIMPVSIAMQHTGVDQMIGSGAVTLVGEFGPLAVLAALFVATATLTQLMGNTATVVIMLPPGIAAAATMGVSPMPMILGIVTAAMTAFLTPVSTPNNLMIQGPGGYRFGDFWKIGSVTMVWWFAVTMVVIPWWWPFTS
jgi:di/tricarboxylate transporter